MPLGPTQSVETIFDSCLKVIYRQRNGTIVERNKRRPKGSVANKCTWVVLCPDHPHKGNRS